MVDETSAKDTSERSDGEDDLMKHTEELWETARYKTIQLVVGMKETQNAIVDSLYNAVMSHTASSDLYCVGASKRRHATATDLCEELVADDLATRVDDLSVSRHEDTIDLKIEQDWEFL